MQSDKINKSDQNSAKLEEKVKSIAKKEGYITYEVQKRSVSSESGGHMGVLFIFRVKGKTEEGNKVTNIFVKQIVNYKVKMIFDLTKIYKRELFVYTDLMKEMYDLQRKENVPVIDMYDAAKAFEESDDENIVLEDLTAQGFKTWYKMDVMSLAYAELAVKQLARFHGLSMAMQKKRPDYFEMKIKCLDSVYICDEYFQAFTQSMRMIVTQFLPEDLQEKLTPALTDIVDRYPSYMNDTSCVRTLCHGDFRHSNILVKEIAGKPAKVIAVDYQMTYFGNPVLDFIYLIFWGTDQQFRRSHLENLKQLYYQHLATFLNYFSIDVEEVFSRREFERQYQEKLDFGLMVSMIFLPFQFSVETDLTKIDESDKLLVEGDFKFDDRYNERFRGIVNDFIEWGYL